MSRPMIITAGAVAVVAAVLALIWTLHKIRRIQAPLLVIAGGRDRIVPIDQSRRLYEAAAMPKTLFVLPDADHNDDELLAGDDMIRAIVRFLQPLR